jgi:DNA polymerase
MDLIDFGRESDPHGCRFSMDGPWMRIDLPTGDRPQTLWYFQPCRRQRGSKFDLSYKTMKAGRWMTKYLYGGILTENIVQALARGLLCTAMGRLEEREKRPIVLTVHDEVICEVPEDRVDMAGFKRIMEEPVEWAVKMQVPIAVECPEQPWTRYQK